MAVKDPQIRSQEAGGRSRKQEAGSRKKQEASRKRIVFLLLSFFCLCNLRILTTFHSVAHSFLSATSGSTFVARRAGM